MSGRTISRNATATAWAYAAAQELAKGPWAVLMMLARRVNNKRDDFDVWPGQELIAADAGMSVASVKRHLNTLEDGRWLVRTRRSSPGRGFTGLTYTLNVVARFEMPNGAAVTVDFFADDEGGRQLKSDEPVAQNEQSRQLNGELPNREPYKVEHKKEKDSPVVPTGDTQEGLFGDEPGSPSFEDRVCDRFVQGWARMSAAHDRVPSMRTIDKKRRSSLLARVRESMNGSGVEAGFAVVDELFEHIEGSPYLCGETAPFVVRPDNVLTPSGWLKTMERPNERGNENRFDLTRPGGSAVRAGQSVLDDLRNRRLRAEAGM